MLFRWRRQAGTVARVGQPRLPLRRRGRSFHPQLETLEDRTLLSTSIPLQNQAWTPIGPAPILRGQVPGTTLLPNNALDNTRVSGRITGIAADPADLAGNTLFVATAGGGVWKTTDANAPNPDWAPLTDDQPTLVMGSIDVIHPAGGQAIIYAGTGEADNSGDSFYGLGVLKSADGGTSWTLLTGNGAFDRRAVTTVLIDDFDPTGNTVYVAVGDNTVNGLTGNTGIWRTTDGGASWQNITAGRIGTGTEDFTALVIDPNNRQHLFAAVGEVGATTTSVNGVYETTNALGFTPTWAAAGNFPNGDPSVGRIALSIAPLTGGPATFTLWASVSNLTTGDLNQIYNTQDAATWSISTGRPAEYLHGQGDYDQTLLVDPTNPQTVYVGGSADPNGVGSAILQSTDDGTSWTDISNTNPPQTTGPHADHHAIAVDSLGRVLVGTDGGIWRLNAGTPVTWSDLNGDLNTAQITSIALHPTDANVAFAGSQDNGTNRFNDSLTWDHVADGDGGDVRVDPSNPSTVYHVFGGSPLGLERSDDGGTTWTGITVGINVFDTANFYPPLVLDPSNPSRLFFGTNRLYLSTNRGNTWNLVNPPPGGFGSFFDNTIDSIAVAPSDPKTIYVSAGGVIQKTVNGGALWTTASQPGGFFDNFPQILVDPTDSRVLYAVRNAFSGAPGGHVFRSSDGGTNWSDISAGLPDLPVWSIVLDPGPTPDTLYVGTDQGVYSSEDGGITWTPFRPSQPGLPSLPNVQVRSLELNDRLRILAAGTYGRGVWELDLSGQITGTVYDDQNNDKVQDVGEPGLQGWTVFLDANANGTLDPGETSTLSDASGAYRFTGLSSGTYRVREIVNAGWTQTTAPPADVDLTAGQTEPGGDFGNFKDIIISGRVFEDVNGNGKSVPDAGEPGLAGRTVFLDDNDNGTLDPGEAVSTTDAAGNYTFKLTQVRPYLVREVVPTGWEQTTANPAPISGTNGGQSAVNFGTFRLVTLDGRVFRDTNGNGTLDTGEPGLPGWTVFLDANNNATLDAGERSTVSDSVGHYSFANVGHGTRAVREVVQPGWAQSSALLNPTPTSGVPLTGQNLGNFQLTSITGRVFADNNGNGVLDAGEPGLAGWTVFLDTNLSGLPDSGELSTVTDGSGGYAFTGLGAGVRHVRTVLPAGWAQTTPPLDVTPTSGAPITGANIGNFRAFSISGTVYMDSNNNRVRDPGEPGLANWVLFLDTNANGAFDSGEASTATDFTGKYSFTGLTAGFHRVRQVLPPGWFQSTANPPDIPATNDGSAVGVDFGDFQVVTIQGQVFKDANANGALDPNEPGLANWTVYIDGNSNDVLDAGETTAVTDLNGNYTITLNSPGTYRVRAVTQPGWVQTTLPPPDIFAISGTFAPGVNLGFFQPGTVSGQVFEDVNGNAAHDAGEPGLQNRSVFSDLNGNGILDPGETSALTDAQGNYLLVGLASGTHTIRQVLPVGWLQTTASPAAITVAVGTNVTGVDFGDFRTFSISGVIFQDGNGDGVRDPGEAVQQGFAVVLDANNNGRADAGERQAVSAADGTYRFNNVGPGDYSVLELLPAGWRSTTPNPVAVTGASGVDRAGVNFGNLRQLRVFATGADRGAGPDVRVYDVKTGAVRFSFFAYDPAFFGGVRVAVGDVNGDGFDDVITAPGPGGGPDIKVVDGRTGALAAQFFAFDPGFLGGVYVAAGDVNGDGFDDLIFGADFGGGPNVTVVSGRDFTPLANFFAYGIGFTGGVRVAAGDINRDGRDDIICGAGPGGGPNVTVFSGADLSLLTSFFPYALGFTGGIYVAAGDVNGDGFADMITGVGPGGGPNVSVFSGTSGALLTSFSAYPAFTPPAPTGFISLVSGTGSTVAQPLFGGVRVGAVDFDGDGVAEVITGPGPGQSPLVKVIKPLTDTEIDTFFAYSANFLGGVFVGGSH